MGRAVARDNDRRRAGVAGDGDGGGTRGSARTLRPARRGRAGLCVRDRGGGGGHLGLERCKPPLGGKAVDWDDAYANRPYIPDAETYEPRWAAEAAAFRREMGERAELDLAYGD